VPSLIAIFLIHITLRYWDDDAITATGACVLLFAFMAATYRFGRWTSLRNATMWLRNHPRSALLLFSGMLVMSFMLFVPESGSLARRMAYLIEGFFFWYAGLAITDAVVGKLFRLSNK